MPESFDAYHRWLGIPPEQQPADHYRLLGLAAFERDPEVIRDAAERQMAFVRRHALGKHGELSQKILNELATAKACLLDAARRTRYDVALRRKKAVNQGPAPAEVSAAIAPGVQRPPSPRSLPGAAAAPPRRLATSVPRDVPATTRSRPTSQPNRRDRTPLQKPLQSPWLIAVASAGAVLVVLAGVAIFKSRPAAPATNISATGQGPSEVAPSSKVAIQALQDNPRSPFSGQAKSPSFPVPHGSMGAPEPAAQRAKATPDNSRSSAWEKGGPARSGDSGETQNLPAGTPPTSIVRSGLRAVPLARPDEGGTVGLPSTRESIIRLPSGKVLPESLFANDEGIPKNLLADNSAHGVGLTSLGEPGKPMYALINYRNGKLDGLTVAYRENKKPMMCATYSDGVRNGVLRTWNADGQRVFWGQYAYGKREGFCCLFTGDMLSLALECTNDHTDALHMFSDQKLLATYEEENEARQDPTVDAALTRLTALDSEIKSNEKKFSIRVKQAEHAARMRTDKEKEAERQKLAAEQSVIKRGMIGDRINQRGAGVQDVMNRVKAASQGR